MVAGSSIPECAVCLQTCVHPAQLPCGHIFCFLCVKGVANQSKKCAMCRQEIPTDYFEKPVLVAQNNTDKDSTAFDDGYQWFYEGRNGKYGTVNVNWTLNIKQFADFHVYISFSCFIHLKA